jgi:hypothetical protein
MEKQNIKRTPEKLNKTIISQCVVRSRIYLPYNPTIMHTEENRQAHPIYSN